MYILSEACIFKESV